MDQNWRRKSSKIDAKISIFQKPRKRIGAPISADSFCLQKHPFSAALESKMNEEEIDNFDRKFDRNDWLKLLSAKTVTQAVGPSIFDAR